MPYRNGRHVPPREDAQDMRRFRVLMEVLMRQALRQRGGMAQARRDNVQPMDAIEAGHPAMPRRLGALEELDRLLGPAGQADHNAPLERLRALPVLEQALEIRQQEEERPAHDDLATRRRALRMAVLVAQIAAQIRNRGEQPRPDDGAERLRRRRAVMEALRAARPDGGHGAVARRPDDVFLPAEPAEAAQDTSADMERIYAALGLPYFAPVYNQEKQCVESEESSSASTTIAQSDKIDEETGQKPVDLNEWKHFVTQDHREHLIDKIVQFMSDQFPSVPRVLVNPRMANKLEASMFEKATSRKEYYDLVAAKICLMEKEFATMRRWPHRLQP